MIRRFQSCIVFRVEEYLQKLASERADPGIVLFAEEERV
jgi:hypothetical protein